MLIYLEHLGRHQKQVKITGLQKCKVGRRWYADIHKHINSRAGVIWDIEPVSHDIWIPKIRTGRAICVKVKNWSNPKYQDAKRIKLTEGQLSH